VHYTLSPRHREGTSIELLYIHARALLCTFKRKHKGTSEKQVSELDGRQQRLAIIVLPKRILKHHGALEAASLAEVGPTAL
jgi:hypothetical protein